MNKFGLPKKTINSLNQVFSKFPKVEQVILYGSRAKGNYRDGSDIDLTLKGNNLSLDDLLKIENPDFLEHIERVGVLFK